MAKLQKHIAQESRNAQILRRKNSIEEPTSSVERMAYSLEETAQALGLSINHTRAILQRGEIASRKSGKRWLAPVSAVKRYLGES